MKHINLAYPAPITILMDVCPALAAFMLSSSAGNRALRKYHISSLASDMASGKWITTNQGIGFTKEGVLVDGHHRLQAVVESGATIKIQVSFGLDSNAYQVIDQGVIRTTADVFGGSRKLAQVLNLSASFLNGTNSPTKQQVAPFYGSEIKRVYDRVTETCGRTTRRVISSAPFGLATCLLIIDEADEVHVLGQYKALLNLDYDAMSKQAKMLTKQIDSGHVTGNNAATDIMARATIALDSRNSRFERVTVADSAWVNKWAKQLISKCLEGGAQ